MLTRCLLIASSAMALAGAAAAGEPAKPEAREAVPATIRPPVILASADQVQTPPQAVEERAETPAKKPRAARVTSCRCAGQTQR